MKCLNRFAKNQIIFHTLKTLSAKTHLLKIKKLCFNSLSLTTQRSETFSFVEVHVFLNLRVKL